MTTAAYTIGTKAKADTPVFSLAAGTYTGTQTVYLSDSTDGTGASRCDDLLHDGRIDTITSSQSLRRALLCRF